MITLCAPGLSTKQRPFRIHGAGIAGACLAYQFKAMGLDFDIYEPQRPGAGASGNAVALLEPRLIVRASQEAYFRERAFLYATDFYQHLSGENQTELFAVKGVRQLPSNAYSPARLAKIKAGFGGIYPPWLQEFGPGLFYPTGGALIPKNVLNACFCDCDFTTNPQAAQDPQRVHIFATGMSTLPPSLGSFVSSLIPNRGVLSRFAATPLAQVVSGHGYAVTHQNSTFAGATFEGYVKREPQIVTRYKLQTEQSIRAVDHAFNRQQALALLKKDLGPAIDGRMSYRATTGDRLPLVGQVSPNQWLFLGFGSRGFTYAPLLAAQLTAELAGLKKKPIPAAERSLMRANRFAG